VAIEALSGNDKWYFLSNAPTSTPLDELVGAAMRRHLIEERFEVAKGEAGLDHYEVRSWLGWHHHMASSLVPLWFLLKEQRRLGQDGPALGGDGALHLGRAASPPPLAS
jgi:SRSO17 transposase